MNGEGSQGHMKEFILITFLFEKECEGQKVENEQKFCTLSRDLNFWVCQSNGLNCSAHSAHSQWSSVSPRHGMLLSVFLPECPIVTHFLFFLTSSPHGFCLFVCFWCRTCHRWKKDSFKTYLTKIWSHHYVILKVAKFVSIVCKSCIYTHTHTHTHTLTHTNTHIQ